MTIPFALFVYNRSDNLIRTLDCLKANKIEKLYVFSDGPRYEAAADGVKKVRQLIKKIDWTEVEVIERKTNFGLSRSIREGLNYLFERYDKVIVIEDDVLVAPNFYDYMKNCLNYYADKPEVAGVTGLCYPFDRSVFDKYRYDVFFSQRFSSWGWGTWRRWWQTVDFDLKSLNQKVKKTNWRPNLAGRDMDYMVKLRLNSLSHGVWDVDCAINMLLNNQYFVCPKYNLVENWDLAGGSHAGDFLSDKQLKWEDAADFNANKLKFPPKVATNPSIMDQYINFFPPLDGPIPSKMSRLLATMKTKLNSALKN